MSLTLPPALRSMRRSPAFLGSAVAVLSLGMTAAIVVFAIARALLLHPVDYRDPASLVQLRERDPRGSLAPLTAAEFRLARDRSDLSGVAAIDLGMFQLTGVAEPEEFAGAAITPDTLATLGIRPLLGHDLAADRPDEVLLTYRAWTRRFGADPAIVGKVIDLDWSRTPAHERYRVAGVLPPRFWLVYRGLEVFIPLTDSILANAAPRRRYYAIARQSGVAIPFDAAGRAVVPSPFVAGLTEDSRPAVALLSAAALLLLLLACANVSSLFLARGLRRQNEFAVRLAIGASRGHLARLVLAEAFCVSLAAALLAAPAARGALQLLDRLLPADAGWAQFTPGIDRIGIDAWTLAFAAVAAFLCAAFAGAFPAVQSSAIADRLRAGGARRRGRQALIALEAALATSLLCGAGLLFQSLLRLDRADLGFARARLLVVRVPRIGARPDPAYYDELRRRVESIPGVESVAFTSYQPLTHTRPERRFSLSDGTETAASYCVVDRAFLSVYGARIQFAGDPAPFEIVGVVADIRQSLRAPAPYAAALILLAAALAALAIPARRAARSHPGDCLRQL